MAVLTSKSDHAIVDVLGSGEGLAIVGAGTGVAADLPAPTAVKVESIATAEPVPEDPRGGKFTLADAFAGSDELAHGQGKLFAQLHVNGELLHCELFEDRAPIAVANFVGLIRGTRETLDPATNRWTKKRFYQGLTFHRVVDGFVIQGGDPEGTGKGGPGYKIPDEIDPAFHFDRPGILAMANSGPNTGGSQFYITLAATPHLDGRQTAFGQCDPEAPKKLGKVATGERDVPTKPIKIGKTWVIRVDEEPPQDIATPTIAPEPSPESPADPTQLERPEDR
ncbi:MAG TPA: peptidylprolyl isomerase [Nannocystaceae bacterium]|nr:peptidylprolyl isomerase [Nannocystaceae bacterium]